jgi:hypothetical protein
MDASRFRRPRDCECRTPDCVHNILFCLIPFRESAPMRPVISYSSRLNGRYPPMILLLVGWSKVVKATTKREYPEIGAAKNMRRLGIVSCPYCGSAEVYASAPKRFRERLYSFFLVRLVRCHVCMRRHLRPAILPAAKYPGKYTIPTKSVQAVPSKKGEKRSA